MSRWSYQRTILAACTLAFFATMVARLAISPVVPLIEADLGVSNAWIGLALTGMWLTYALSQFPSGLLADREGERRVILLAVVGTALGSAIVAGAPVFPVFAVGAAVLGALAGLHYSVATSFLARTQPNAGTAIGFHNAGAPVAGLLAPVAAGSVGEHLGWRPAVAIGCVVALPAAGLFLLGVRPTPPQRPDERIRDRLELVPIVELLSRPRITYVGALCVGGEFVWQATASFLPAFLVGHHGYSPTTAGLVFSGYFVVQGVAQPVVGNLSDRIGRYVAAALTTVAGVAGYALLVLGTGLWAVLAATALVGLAMSWGAALLPAIVDELGTEEQAAGFGLVRTFYMVLGASGSVVTGVVAETVSWAAAFALLAAVLALVSVALLPAVAGSDSRR